MTNINTIEIVNNINVFDYAEFYGHLNMFVKYFNYRELDNGNVAYDAYYFTSDFGFTYIESREYDRDFEEYVRSVNYVAFTARDVATNLINNGMI